MPLGGIFTLPITLQLLQLDLRCLKTLLTDQLKTMLRTLLGIMHLLKDPLKALKLNRYLKNGYIDLQ